jgi:hypothetical protein
LDLVVLDQQSFGTVLKLIEQWAATYGMLGTILLAVAFGFWAFWWNWAELKKRPGIAQFFEHRSHREFLEHAQRCLNLLRQIQDANGRIVRRGSSGTGVWATALKDSYNHICDVCYRRRHGTEPPDTYFDIICSEADVDTVCKRKWDLGEALEVYRTRLNRLSPPPPNHESLELLIRRSVTQPDLSPRELEAAVVKAIDAAERVLAASC